MMALKAVDVSALEMCTRFPGIVKNLRNLRLTWNLIIALPYLQVADMKYVYKWMLARK